jgi:signal transduction histidine kinase
MVAVEVRAEQIRTLYRQNVAVLLTNVINAAIVAAVLWASVSSDPLLIAWTLAMAIVVAGRIELRRRYFAAAPRSDQAEVWGSRFVAGAAVTGLLWGAGGFLFFEGGPLSQLLITFVIGGMTAAAAGTLACHMPAYLAYVVPAILLLAARVVVYGDPFHLAMTAMLALYALGLYSVARVNHRAHQEAFRFRFDNDELLRQLSGAKEQLEETNRTLEQRVAERGEALRRQSEALRDAQRLESVGRLAGGVAHDFNNLLTVVLANLSILLDHSSVGEAERSMLRDMREAAEKGADLVRQLLAFSGRQRAAPRTLDLNARVAAMHRLLARLIGEHVELKLNLADKALLVEVDPSQIEQVVVNLVTNARDAMPKGGMVTIETGVVEAAPFSGIMRPGRYATLSVRDTGHGMDSQTQGRVFDPFFTTKDFGKGTGLGLATVYGIVEQSGGVVTVESSPGNGSHFRVYLPEAAALSPRDDTALQASR